jgi:hypothetical protein
MSHGGRRAPTSTWCPLGTLRETVWLSLSARRSSTTRFFPFSRRTDAPKTECPNLTKHQTSQNQYQRGSRAPSPVRPYDGERNLSLHLSCPTIVYGAGSRRLRDADAKREGWIIITTKSQQPPAKNLRPRRRPHSALMPRRAKVNLHPHETPNITEPVPERKSCPLTRTPP